MAKQGGRTTYPNCWFSLCMAKKSIGMVLALEYSDNKKKESKKKN
jgi:hypothetical protein